MVWYAEIPYALEQFEGKSCCDECVCQNRTLKIIKRNKLRVHMQVKYSFDKCDYVRMDKSKKHRQKNSGLRSRNEIVEVEENAFRTNCLENGWIR